MGKILVNPNKIRVTVKNIIEKKSSNINGNIFKAKGRIMIPKRTPAVINKNLMSYCYILVLVNSLYLHCYRIFV